MVINILKDKEKKFYLLLPLYKSFLFKKVNFETDSDDKNVKLLVDGLNIKKRKERINYSYDQACKIIDDYTKDKNMCGFKNGKCYSQQCSKKDYYNGCCRLCRYQSSTGCTTSNLACKLFNCSEVTKRMKVIKYEDLKILKLLSFKNRYIIKSDYFSKREDVLKDLYSYSFIYSGIRMTFRIIRDVLCFKNVKKSE